jgi:magnesium transporter
MNNNQALFDEDAQDLEERLNDYHPSDLALWLAVYEASFCMKILSRLTVQFAADILNFMTVEKVADIMDCFEPLKASQLIIEMDTDEATDALKRFNVSKRRVILAKLSTKDRALMNRFLGYVEDSAGSIMTSEAVVLEETMDVKEAMRVLINNAVSAESIQTLFVTDGTDTLVGVLGLKDLIQARSPLTLQSLMEKDFITVFTDTTAEDAARTMRNYQIYLLPVIDHANRFQGVITLDDAADILDEATSEDYARFANVSSEATIRDSVFRSAFHRLPWLTILLGLGLIISGIISSFENVLAEVTVLVLFQPLILGMAGNTGTQSLAVTIRGLANDYYTTKEHARAHVISELKSGMLNGLAIGLLGFLTTIGFLYTTSVLDSNPIMVGVTVALSLAASLSIASLFGTLVPLTLHRFNFDPAVASGPFITTLNDVIALIIYFSLATFIIMTF